jgi:hypothetical protein
MQAHQRVCQVHHSAGRGPRLGDPPADARIDGAQFQHIDVQVILSKTTQQWFSTSTIERVEKLVNVGILLAALTLPAT